jgi:hypothetical protein
MMPSKNASKSALSRAWGALGGTAAGAFSGALAVAGLGRTAVCEDCANAGIDTHITEATKTLQIAAMPPPKLNWIGTESRGYPEPAQLENGTSGNATSEAVYPKRH